MQTFHFLRPEWLWGLIPLVGLLLLLVKRGKAAQAWESVCDPHLLPHLLVGTDRAGYRTPLMLLALGWTVTIFALAGPAWSQLPQPVFRAESALVIVLDLSRSMDVQDVAPSRLDRAKHKTLDILKARKEGQTALVVFAGESFVVSPLTDDANTIITFVQSLETNLIPVQGSRADLGLRKAQELLDHVGHAGGDVLLITDGEGDSATFQMLENLRRQGRQVSVLGVGTVDGAPIPESGGFVKDENGSIVIPKLPVSLLHEMAKAGGGRYATLTGDDQDINRVLPVKLPVGTAVSSTVDQRTTDLWREEGPWFVLLIIALALPAFRPGWLGVLFLFVLLPQVSEAFTWEDLWFRPDQQGVRALERQAPEEAATLFQDPGWKGIAHYRAGNYQEAVESFSSVDTAESHYNKGNALANLGRYEEALAAYQTALSQQPTHSDAKHNMEVIRKLLQETSDSPQGKSGSQEAGSSSSGHKNPGDRAGGDQEQSGSNKEAQQEGQGAPGKGSELRPEPLTSPNPENNQQSAENDVARGTTTPDSVKGKQSDQRGSFPSSSAENSGDQTGTDEVAGLPSHEKTSPSEKSEQVLQQWLRRIPDDPGGLLRRKFLLEHQRRVESGRSIPPQGKGW